MKVIPGRRVESRRKCGVNMSSRKKWAPEVMWSRRVMWSSRERRGAAWSDVEQPGVRWSCLERCGAAWSDVEPPGVL